MTSPAVHEQILGKSAAIRKVRRLIELVGPTELPVLIAGPTGAGKELVAGAIHEVSGRLGKFVPFNVCAIPETMFEDTLFGHVRGAFTGADYSSSGYLRQADGGTVFLDEIEALNGITQAKLLRAIETRQFRPVGASADVCSEFRLIAATNEDIWSLQHFGKFRKDLAHRLTSFVIDVPALRERAEDIPLLALAFLRKHGAAVNASLSPDIVRVLQTHDWPGNVRELQHVVRNAVMLGGSPELRESELREAMSWTVPRDMLAMKQKRAERQLLEVLEQCEWGMPEAARQLGIHRTTLYRRLKRAGLPGKRPSSNGTHASELS